MRFYVRKSRYIGSTRLIKESSMSTVASVVVDVETHAMGRLESDESRDL